MKSLFWEKGEFKLWILLLCAYHFFPFITTKGSIVLYIWAYIIPLAYIALNLNYLKKIVSSIAHSAALICVSGIVILICFSLIIPVIYNTGDFTYLTDSILGMVKILIRMLFIVLVIIKNIPEATKETFMKYFIYSCCLYICSTIIMMLFPSIKDVFYQLIKESDHSKLMAMDARYKTRYGWGGFSGFEYTFKCVLAIIFNSYLIETRIKQKRIWVNVGISLFLLVGTLFYGRVGSLFGGCVLVVLFIRLMKKRPKILVGAIIAGVLGCVALFVLQSKNETIRTWFNWAFDLFVTFAKTGKFETESSNVLLEQMLFVPEVRTILFGDGMYTTLSGYYMSTDAGIMRSLLFGGIGFALLRYLSFYIPLGLSLFKTKMKSADKIMYLWVLLLCIVFEVKGEILFSCIPIFIWIMALERYERWRKEKWREI